MGGATCWSSNSWFSLCNCPMVFSIEYIHWRRLTKCPICPPGVNFINWFTPCAKLFAFYAQLLRSFLLVQKFSTTVNENNPRSMTVSCGTSIEKSCQHWDSNRNPTEPKASALSCWPFQQFQLSYKYLYFITTIEPFY